MKCIAKPESFGHAFLAAMCLHGRACGGICWFSSTFWGDAGDRYASPTGMAVSGGMGMQAGGCPMLPFQLAAWQEAGKFVFGFIPLNFCVIGHCGVLEEFMSRI